MWWQYKHELHWQFKASSCEELMIIRLIQSRLRVPKGWESLIQNVKSVSITAWLNSEHLPSISSREGVWAPEPTEKYIKAAEFVCFTPFSCLPDRKGSHRVVLYSSLLPSFCLSLSLSVSGSPKRLAPGCYFVLSTNTSYLLIIFWIHGFA